MDAQANLTLLPLSTGFARAVVGRIGSMPFHWIHPMDHVRYVGGLAYI